LLNGPSETPAQNLIFLIDRSGSMNGMPIQQAKQALSKVRTGVARQRVRHHLIVRI
jgi:uncharacterized protein with von Willebrand factor type A (vWA) domain